MSDHHEVEVITPEGRTISVDQAMAPLLLAAWRAGIRTGYSCQGERGEAAYIAFNDLKSGDKFSVLTERARVAGCFDWKWSVSRCPGVRAKGLRLMVEFPSSAIRSITKALRGRKARAKGPKIPQFVRATVKIVDLNLHSEKRETFANAGDRGRVIDFTVHGQLIEALVAFRRAPHLTTVWLGNNVMAANASQAGMSDRIATM